MDFYFKVCPRCQGDLCLADGKNVGGEYAKCLQCCRIEVKVLESEERVTSRHGLRSKSAVARTITNALVAPFAIGCAATTFYRLNRN